jgi:enterochelin esterase-like enzyme
MKNLMKRSGVILSGLLFVTAVLAASIDGQWRTEFDTPVGHQKYVFNFQAEGEKLSGRADAESDGEPRKVEFTGVKLSGDTVSFVEMLKFQDNDICIEYTGQVGTNEIKFSRKVGDFANEDFVAQRVQPTPPPTEVSTNNNADNHAAGGPAALPRRIVLGPDDKRVFPYPPAGFEVSRTNIVHGHLEMIEYDSKAVGTTRKLQVYLPPGYSRENKYPVLYLLHGIGGDETEWERFVAPDVILDNLLADGQVVPMIVVMPNGRAQKSDRAEGDIFKAAPAFANFERDLLDDVIPAIDARYATLTNREARALAGLSMGGGQSLNFGLAHLDTFAWIGAFSAAPNTKPPAELVPEPAAVTPQLRLLWLSAGNQDGLISINQGVHGYLKVHHVPHVWNVDGNAHNPPEWKNNFYWFSQQLFK